MTSFTGAGNPVAMEIVLDSHKDGGVHREQKDSNNVVLRLAGGLRESTVSSRRSKKPEASSEIQARSRLVEKGLLFEPIWAVRLCMIMFDDPFGV